MKKCCFYKKKCLQFKSGLFEFSRDRSYCKNNKQHFLNFTIFDSISFFSYFFSIRQILVFFFKYLVRVIANKMYHIAMMFSHQIHWNTLRTFSSIILTNFLRENFYRYIEVNKSCIYILFADET